MKDKLVFAVLAMVVLVIGIAVTGCASDPASTPNVVTVEGVPITSKLDELLRKYMGPRETTRNNSGPWYEWYLDPLRFEEFKAELDADGEYSQTGSFPNNDRGTPEALWVVIPDGGFQLELRKEDGSGVVYEYKKVLGTSGHKVDELLRRYMGSSEQTWDEGLVHIYYLDPLRFEEFKTEIETGGEYYEDNRWTNANRDWDRGMTSAWWVDVTGGGFILELLKKDNSTVGYGYGKISE